MLKFRDDGEGCASCCAGIGGCGAWRVALRAKGRTCNGEYYANKEQVEWLLAYHENKVGAEFRKGDKVFDLSKGNGIVDKVNEANTHNKVIVYFGSGVIGWYTAGGVCCTRGKNRMLYHGHDLTITIGEKLPTRIVDKWVFLYLNSAGQVMASDPYDTQEYCNAVMQQGNALHSFVALWEPIKVPLPNLEP